MSCQSKLKTVFLGELSTGKTFILTRFIQDKFDSQLGPTLGVDYLTKTVTMNKEVLRVQFWDTAGQQRFRSLIPNYLKEALIAFLVFDVTNRSSFINLPSWIDLCHQNMSQRGVIVLLGNKSDMEGIKTKLEEIAVLCEKYKIKYFEVSAKTGQKIKQSLNYACEELLKIKSRQKSSQLQISKTNDTKILKNKGKFSLNTVNLKFRSITNRKDYLVDGGCCSNSLKRMYHL